MDIQILQNLQDFSAIAVLGLFIVAMFPIFKVIAKWIESKLNNKIPFDVSEGVKEIKENHIHEIVSALNRIENTLEKTSDNIIYIKSKFNKT